jgi:hypothetical protein
MYERYDVGTFVHLIVKFFGCGKVDYSIDLFIFLGRGETNPLAMSACLFYQLRMMSMEHLME